MYGNVFFSNKQIKSYNSYNVCSLFLTSNKPKKNKKRFHLKLDEEQENKLKKYSYMLNDKIIKVIPYDNTFNPFNNIGVKETKSVSTFKKFMTHHNTTQNLLSSNKKRDNSSRQVRHLIRPMFKSSSSCNIFSYKYIYESNKNYLPSTTDQSKDLNQIKPLKLIKSFNVNDFKKDIKSEFLICKN
jgi:hypothetical protein